MHAGAAGEPGALGQSDGIIPMKADSLQQAFSAVQTFLQHAYPYETGTILRPRPTSSAKTAGATDITTICPRKRSPLTQRLHSFAYDLTTIRPRKCVRFTRNSRAIHTQSLLVFEAAARSDGGD
jgi:hypothetical protein